MSLLPNGASVQIKQVKRLKQSGFMVWLLLLLSGIGQWIVYSHLLRYPANQLAQQKTDASLALAQQALLAYAYQPLQSTTCELNCPRPGDLPCPDRNNDGIAEGTCSNTARLGRLPWKTLGVGDVRDGSGERLWYAVSERYKNNPRILPLNLDTTGTWSVASSAALRWDATQGSGVVAVLIAPMQPLVRADGWIQQRQDATSDISKHYLDQHAAWDNANPQEGTTSGFVMASLRPYFNDVVWPITASQMHQAMQKQVLSELSRSLRCTTLPCNPYPQPAAVDDVSCLSQLTLLPGQCLSAASDVGRLPLDSNAHWAWASQHALDGSALHHWFQQNGWREQVFYQRSPSKVTLVVAGERLSGQSREVANDKTRLNNYLEATTLLTLHVVDATALHLPSYDLLQTVDGR